MEIKKFHLKDFPAERIRVLFKDNKKFLEESINYFGSLKKLAQFLSVSPQVVHFWKKLNLFIPLKELCNGGIIAKSNKIGQKIIWTKLEV